MAWPWYAAGAALVGIVATAVVMTVTSSDAGGDSSRLPGSVTSEPERGWVWEADSGGTVEQARPLGDGVALAVRDDADTMTVVVLDGAGEVVLEEEHENGTIAVDPSSDTLLVREIEGGTTGYSRTGEELWSRDGGEFAQSGDLLLVADGDAVRAESLTTGEEVWAIDLGGRPDAAGVYGDLAVLVVDDEVRAYDLGTGTEEWTAPVETGSEELTVAVTEQLVVLRVGEELVAYDADGGRELWREAVPTDLDDSAYLWGFGDDLVGLGQPHLPPPVSALGDEPPEEKRQEVVLYGPDGRRGEIETAHGLFELQYVPVDDGFLVDPEGTAYDLDGEELEVSYPGVAGLSRDGAYVLDRGELGFQPWGEEETRWEVDVDDAAQRQVVAAEERIYVLERDQVTEYR